MEHASPDSGTTDGSQLPSLNKGRPPVVNLLLFLPICPSQTNGFPLQSAASPTLPLSAMQVQPGMANPFKVPLVAPLDYVQKSKQDPAGDAPLDLSMKCRSPGPALSNTSLQSVKSEPAAVEASARLC